MRKVTLQNIVLALITAVMVAGMAVGAYAKGAVISNKGSDTLLPLASAWAEVYMNKHPNAIISVTGGGSGVGFASLINGSCDIANASRAAKPKEISQALDRNVILKATVVAKDGLAVIVNPKNPINGLSISQLAKLYSNAKNWKEVGGINNKVIATGRDSSSGTYVFFQDEVLNGKRYRSDMLSLPSNNAICQMVSQDEGGIGYVGLAFAKEFAAKHKVKIITISGVIASEETVKSGKYPLWRPLYCYTNGKPKGKIADFLNFAISQEGQKIVEKVGYISR